jgi:hypothetical protein
MVFAAGDDLLAVGRERHLIHMIGVADELAHFPPGLQIPQARSPIIAAAQPIPSVR